MHREIVPVRRRKMGTGRQLSEEGMWDKRKEEEGRGREEETDRGRVREKNKGRKKYGQRKEKDKR